MKKKILIITLALAIAFSTISFSFASSSFTDIKDETTATAAEVLKLMGVVDGVGDGLYNPTRELNRAEFCKLAVLSMNNEADFNKYSSMTIFPDVKASEWYAPFVNMAAKGLSIVAGYPDGTFKPTSTINLGEALTVLLRLIGYTDEEVGGVWPYGHVSFAKSAGMLNGMSVSNPKSAMTRADAAKLFVNTIKMDAQNKRSTFSFSNETVLKSVNVGQKTMTTADGMVYNMVKSASGSTLVGKTGYVVTRSDGKAVTFVPKSMLSMQGDVCIVIKKDGDSAALTAMAGRSDYSIYKNGALVTADKLKVNDIAVYRASENKVLVCDTKLSVLYEGVAPSPASPSVVTALCGKGFEVMSSAESTISKYKPGSHLSLYLTADGRIGAAGSYGYTGNQNNAVFIVDMDGRADLVCGTEVIDLNLPVQGSNLFGKTARLNFVNGGVSNPSLSFVGLSGNAYGALDSEAKKLGSKKIAENALVFENGEVSSLETLSSKNVIYARENVNGEIDLIAVYDALAGKLVAGEANIETRLVYSEYGFDPYEEYVLTFANQNDSADNSKLTTCTETGKFYAIANDNGKSFVNVKKLSFLASVTKDAFRGDSLVETDNTTLALFKDVACYNQDTGAWTNLESALVYGRGFTLYGIDGTVYVLTYSY